MELRVDNGAILAYRRLNYRPWYALAEFVDNSIDSYLRPNNHSLLSSVFAQTNSRLEVEIDYSRDDDLLRISDNSIGMTAAELEAALVIGSPPPITAGLSEFGMGMKTSAIWFADQIRILTEKYGDTSETAVTLNVPEFVQGNRSHEVRSMKKPEKAHYTVVELTDLKRRLGPSAFSKTSVFLGSIYREYVRDGVVNLTINGQSVDPPPSRNDNAFILRSDGSPLVIPVDVDIKGRRVPGWIGVLRPGFTGRSHAGFALLRNRRAVKGWVDSWRPEEIFGDARNDTLNQRLAGELTMDAFRASHTKDAIDWEDDDEYELGKKLKDLCLEYDMLREAKRRTRTDKDSEEDDREKQEAINVLQRQLSDDRVEDAIQILDVPTPELTRVQNQPLQDVLDEAEDQGVLPIASWKMGNERFARLYLVNLSPNDPYFEFEVLASRDLKIVLNDSHPALSYLGTAEARLAHYHHVVIEAIAEWQCAQQSAEIHPATIRLMKDRLFRSVAEVESD